MVERVARRRSSAGSPGRGGAVRGRPRPGRSSCTPTTLRLRDQVPLHRDFHMVCPADVDPAVAAEVRPWRSGIEALGARAARSTSSSTAATPSSTRSTPCGLHAGLHVPGRVGRGRVSYRDLGTRLSSSRSRGPPTTLSAQGTSVGVRQKPVGGTSLDRRSQGPRAPGLAARSPQPPVRTSSMAGERPRDKVMSRFGVGVSGISGESPGVDPVDGNSAGLTVRQRAVVGGGGSTRTAGDGSSRPQPRRPAPSWRLGEPP